MENIQNNDMSYTLYPQARYANSGLSSYSNTNNCNYNKIDLNSRNLTFKDDLLDPIAREKSNNITREFNSRIENANKLNEALNIIRDSIMDEAEDAYLYSMMLNQTMQDEDREIIQSIVDDEKKHNMMLRQIYFNLTGLNVTPDESNISMKENTYLNNLRKSLFGELDAIKKYRKVLAAMTDKENYNMIMEIMTDEITHANKYNYLITKYMVNQEEAKNTK